jgi:hypothetical protein
LHWCTPRGNEWVCKQHSKGTTMMIACLLTSRTGTSGSCLGVVGDTFYVALVHATCTHQALQAAQRSGAPVGELRHKACVPWPCSDNRGSSSSSCVRCVEHVYVCECIQCMVLPALEKESIAHQQVQQADKQGTLGPRHWVKDQPCAPGQQHTQQHI